MAKRTVEGCLCLKITDIKDYLGDKQGKELALSSSDGNRFMVYAFEDSITMSYRYDGEHVITPIQTARTMVGYGERIWFECPDCKRNTAALYEVDGLFSCRVCQNLNYTSSQLSGNRLEYLASRIRKLDRKLDFRRSNMGEEAPIFKPKGMHQATFDRLRQELEIVQRHWLEEWMRWAEGGA